MSDPESSLRAIAQRLEALDPSAPLALGTNDISILFDSFLPSSQLSSRSLAYVVLAKLCSLHQQKDSPEKASAALAKTFAPELEARLSTTISAPVISALEVFRALFHVDPAASATLFAQPDINSALEDIPEIFSDASSPVLRPLASLLAQAASDSTCRSLIDERGRSWLVMQSRQTRDPQLRAAAAVALTKLVQGAPTASLESQVETESKTQKTRAEEQALLKMMSNLVVSGSAGTNTAGPDSSLVDSIEGLTHLSASSEHKNAIAKDIGLLKKMFALAGVLPALSALAQSTSIGVRRAAGSAYLGLVTEQANRGRIIQGGGVKALLHISQRATYDRPPSSNPPSSSGSSAELAPIDLLSLQALAKLTITHPPNLLFGPTPRTAVGPLSNLLAHKDATTLQQFEALMALTNIASVDADGVIKGTSARLVEELMLAEHKMVRRAAVELLCNLIGSEEMWARYTGEEATATEKPLPTSKAVQSRLHVLMALSDVDDLPTRRAASGALAMLTSSDSAVNSLLSLERGPSRLTKVVRELVQPSDDAEEDSGEGEEEQPQEHDASLTLRGVTIARNMLYNSASQFKDELVNAAQDMGLLAALLETVKGGDGASKQLAAEALVWLGRARGQIPPA
ncbi:hypothetical protein FRC06_000236 [Ceratobasidium sp. 370]|nr:hypothetical protein FRC06_000236 [Ceratobasidium sp. 370]